MALVQQVLKWRFQQVAADWQGTGYTEKRHFFPHSDIFGCIKIFQNR